MFAYCGNNPVINVDYSGNRYCAATSVSGESKNDRRRSCDFQWRVVQNNVYRATYAEELAVLEGRSSTYKGTTVVRTENDYGSFSFGKIYLNSVESANERGIQTLRHEYGHTKQLETLGTVNYALLVVLPSFAGATLNHLGLLTVDYYSLPWEYEADIYGNVSGRGPYDPNALWWLLAYRKDVDKFINR